MATVLRDAYGEFCGECGETLLPPDKHTCKPIEMLSLADANVACQTLEDTILQAAEAWDKLTFSPSTRLAAHARIERWFHDLKRRARVQEYHSRRVKDDG
jgi:hypothetical protein